MNYETLCRKTMEVTARTAEFIREEALRFNKSAVEYKGKNNLVSYVDKTAEKMIVDELMKLLPDAGFITEEDTRNHLADTYNWIIDPLDGTTNFIHGIPCYSISIALMRNREIVLGIVHEINMNECFYSWEGGQAFLNGQAVQVTGTEKLKEALIATGFPYTDYTRMKEYMAVFNHCMNHTHGLRRLGSAAVDLAYVACGRFEGFYEYGLNPWDVAAGAFLVQQAGGTVTDFNGGEAFVFGKEIVACNKNIHEAFLNVIKENFNRPGR